MGEAEGWSELGLSRGIGFHISMLANNWHSLWLIFKLHYHVRVGNYFGYEILFILYTAC